MSKAQATGGSGVPSRPRSAMTQPRPAAQTARNGGRRRGSAAAAMPSDPSPGGETPDRDVVSSGQNGSGVSTRHAPVSDAPKAIDAGTARPAASFYRGRARLSLIRDLAMGEWSYRELALMCGTVEGIIEAFAADHSDEISEVRAALAGQLAIETAGLWITKRQNRLAEMQQDTEDVNEVLDAIREAGISRIDDDYTALGFGLGTRRHVNLLKAKLALLRAASDELTPTGRLKGTTSDGETTTVRFVIDGDDIQEAL